MKRPTQKVKAGGSIAKMLLENPALNAHFELFLPKGWSITKTAATHIRKARGSKPSRKSRRKR